MNFFTGRALSRVALLTLISVLSTAGLAFAYMTDSGIYLPLNYYTFVPPAAGGTYVDGSFGTTVKRVSNARGTPSSLTGGYLGMVTNEYSTMSPFNKDNTRLIIQHDSYFGLYDGNGNYIKDLPFVINAGAEPRWSKTDANVIYFINGNQLKQFNVASSAQIVVHTFSEYGAISGKGESDISEDGNHFVLTGDGRYVFVYEISTGSKGAVLDAGSHSFDSLYMTPNNNVTITWYQNGTARYSGIEMFDPNMNFVRQVARAGGHMDVARDVNGDEVLIWANSADPQPVCDNGIVKIRLQDAQQTCLLSLDWSLATHTSAPDNNGWVFVETYAPADPNPLSFWPKYTNEILQIRLDGSEVRRLVDHRSRPFDTYYYTPRASTSHDGAKLVYSSNYGLQQTLGYPSLYVDTYMIDIAPSTSTPTTAPTTTPPPPPLPTPTPLPTPLPTITTRFEQTDSSVALSGGWAPNTLSLHSGGSAVLSMTAGDRATFSFNGTGANWIAYRDEWSGIARVYVDGALLGQIDTYATPSAGQATAYSVSALASGAHTLAIEVTGTKNAASAGAWVWVDAFDASTAQTPPAPVPPPAPSPTVVRLEESSTPVNYTGNWYSINLAAASAGSTVLSMDAGARASLTFTGTAVSWIGYRDEWSGIAKVILDGSVVANVDTYLTPAQAQAATYSLKNLTSGTHTLIIEVTGEKNRSSGGYWVWVDAFDVTN